ncbi:MAG: sulfatase, partial [Kiritimatiellales bacterium]|nr:sulfatase [Kiritimatiellales bacterium]
MTGRRNFLRAAGLACAAASVYGKAASAKRPNILFALADDWGAPHASIMGDTVVKTPTFDSIARNGILFHNAFVIAPSCTPCRNSIMTGQYPWRLGRGVNLWSEFPDGFQTFPNILEDNGYFVGSYRKAFGPGKNRERPVDGTKYESVEEFFAERPKDKPFCFWFGTSDPHRSYKWQSGIESGMKLEDVQVPPYFPDSEEVRTDICDYYWEVQRFDRETGEVLKKIEEMGELDNTLVVMSGDHGWPFPRCKANLYDSGTHVCLAMQWASRIKQGRTVDDFISFHDFAPTFLEAAGLKPLPEMTGRSLMTIFDSPKSGRIEAFRDHVICSKERHTPCQGDLLMGTPMRSIRTKDFLYIHNFKPDRWPAGAPESKKGSYGDIDGGPTKDYILEHKDEPGMEKYFKMACAKRPEGELFDVRKDPYQLNNLADNPEYAHVMK